MISGHLLLRKLSKEPGSWFLGGGLIPQMCRSLAFLLKDELSSAL